MTGGPTGGGPTGGGPTVGGPTGGGPTGGGPTGGGPTGGGPIVGRPGVSAIVLAGGRSRRFGTDKLRAVVDGETILGRAMSAVAAVADEVVLVASPLADPESLLGEARVLVARPIRVVRDPESYPGPFIGLATGLASVTNPVALVAAGDMPWLHAGVLGLLVDELLASDVAAASALEPADALLTASDLETATGPQRLERFPIAVRVATAASVATSLVVAGERRVSALLDALAVRAIPAATWLAIDADGLTVRDVDRVEDLHGGARRDERGTASR